jgi:competence protein ComEC
MGSGIEAMTWIAYRVAGLPGAVIALPEISGTAFGLMVGGGIWLALWAQPWRLAGIAAMLAGLLVAPLRAPPDVLVGGGGQLVAVRGPDKRLAALDLGRSRFELGRWLEQDGDMRRPEVVGPGRVFRCDPAGCMAEVRGHRIAVVRHASALRDDCRLADLVVWMGQGRTAACPAAARAQVIDRAALEREGAHAISFGGGAAAGMAIATVAGARGARPWSKPRPAGGRGQADRLRREAPD